jgi:DNA (cytosine-5)-methyltransferase 1
MKFGSLFAGIGGFDLGLERAGMECAWQVEREKSCREVLRRHFPPDRSDGVSDVRDAGWRKNLDPVELICGGFPCQDLSVAGRRKGLGGERSGLWWEFHRILGEIRPQWCLIENVPGLLSSGKGRDFGSILGALGDLGYGWAYRVLDARWFGLAQGRKRVFIAGCLGDWAGAAQVLLEPEGVRGDSEAGREEGPDPAGDVAGCLDGSGGGPDDNAAQARHLVAFALSAPKTTSRHDATAETFVVTHTLTGEGHDASEDGTGRGRRWWYIRCSK